MAMCPKCFQDKPMLSTKCPHCTADMSRHEQINHSLLTTVIFYGGFILLAMWLFA